MSENKEFPAMITGIKVLPPLNIRSAHRIKCGDPVSVRPCSDEYEGNTYLGIYIGELPMDPLAFLEEGEVIVMSITNPLILIPEKGVYVRGAESWWGKIDCPDDLQRITTADIENVWYVKLLKELADQLHPRNLSAETENSK